MNTLLNSALTLTYNQLSTFSSLDNFWQVFDTAFGTQYNRSGAEILRLQWLSGDFGQLPQIEILDSSILGNANGAYGSSNNKIYLSANFLATSTAEAISAVLLEEIGHFIDAQINLSDSAGDEGAIFAELVQGYSLDTQTLQALKAEDDHATITVNGQNIQVEQQNFTGTNGNDTITGTSGNDTINSGLGIDVANGGAGDDLLIVDYSIGDTGSGMVLSSYAGTEGFSGSAYRYNSAYSAQLDRVDFSGINRFQITGTSKDDSIVTGSGNDTINSGTGNDDINGGAGNDTINGGDDSDNINGGTGNDTINGGDGDDTINGGTGNDTIDGGAGVDTLTLDLSTQTGNIVINNATTGISFTGIVTATNFENFTITTGSGNDTFNQSGLVNNIVVKSNDNFTAGAGNDTINSGLGIDVANGGAGDDLLIIDYSIGDSGNGMVLSTYAGTEGFSGSAYRYNSAYSAQLDRVDFSGINRFQITGTSKDDSIVTGSGNDTINSGTGNDTINSGAGNDTINGGDDSDNINGGTGNDTINGGDGDDTINGGTGNDTIDGGAGVDTLTLDLSTQTGNIVINNATTGISFTGIVTATNFENFTITTGSGNDTITQSGLVNNIVVKGNDNFTAGTGNDTINSGLGIDVVDGGVGDDLLIIDYSIGDSGNGMVLSTYAGTEGFSGSAYRYNSAYSAQLDRVDFSGINRFQITGTSSNDSITTGSGNDTINGGAGNDDINAGGGNDIIDGVNGASLTPGLGEIDSLTGGTGSDRFILGNATKAYYDDGNTLTNGSNDYADITDFNIGDIIQLQGTSSNYLLAVVGVDTQILINKPGTELDELIGIVRNQTGLSLTGTYFSYVSNVTLPTITLAVSPTSVLEDGATNLVYTFTRTGITTDALTVNYDITGTADSTDYTGATPGTGKTITFAANSATATLTIDPTADTIIESDETVALTLATGTGYLIGTTTAVTGTITNDDTTITLDVSPSSVTEDGTTNLVYTFTRTGITTNALTVNYGITGTANSTDYTGATPGTGKTITFAANSATATLTIDPTADTIIEANETVALTLVAGTGYTLGTTTAVTGTITNDDLLPNINLSTNQTIVEGFTSPQNVTYTVTLTSASSQSITVQYATANGTAIAASDYTSTSGTLTFNPGVTSQVINIPILNDSLSEANEAFTLTLSSPTNANLGTTNTVTTTITDTLSASVTTTLPANVENLTLTGTTAINGTGNAGNNVLTGNSANNTLTGLNGNDTYSFVANSALGIDTITETTTDGIDTITFNGTTVAVNVNLGVTTSQTVNSNLKLILSANNVIENATGGTGNDRLTGNTLNNTLNGGSGNDQLQGLGGDDNLWGGAGNDILNGGIGNDSLWGGLGDDVLTGGVGNDQYLFQSDSVFSISLGVDYITDFEAGLDQIVLSKATFNAITDLLGQALTDFAVVSDDEFVNASNARIVFSQGTGSLFYNQDGNVLGATAVFEFARLGNPDITLTGSNFSLIA